MCIAYNEYVYTAILGEARQGKARLQIGTIIRKARERWMDRWDGWTLLVSSISKQGLKRSC